MLHDSSLLIDALAGLDPMLLEHEFSLLGYGRGSAPPSPEALLEEGFGARIDERTTLFSLARAAAIFLYDGSLERTPFRANDALYEVICRACATDPTQRFANIAAFYSAWRQALP